MTDTIIVSGGDIQSDFALDFLEKKIKENEKICLIAADRGLEFFLEHQLLPDVAIGDFDSLSEEGRGFLEIHEKGSGNGEIPYGGMMGWKVQKSFRDEVKEITVIRLRPEKDDSDTQSAVNHMISEGSREILIFGATGTRLDHVLANLGLLSMGREKGVHIALADQWNYITLVDSGTVLKKEEQFGKYVSFFTVGGDVSGLTLKGFKYPLDGYDLTVADSGLTVSNEIAAETAEVTYDRGSLLMIMSRD